MQGHVGQAFAELDEALPSIGSVFDGRFAIEQLLGRGGMGCVLLARHLELEQQVALKLLRPGRADSERGAVRLLREARASARIKSEHVVRVLDVVSRQKAAPYIVMEYLEGTDLAQHIAQHGPMSVREAAGIVAQACEAVGEGHRLGIVHRDLKPSNLFLCERSASGPFVKVLDFGISKTDDDSLESLTHSHALLGSPVYAAPEQLQASHSADSRADIWSLGVILYECVTGQRPFGGGSLAQVCTQILQQPPLPLEHHRADLPPEFSAVVLRCLAKAPVERFRSVDELLGALALFAPQAVSSSRVYLASVAPVPRGASPVLPSASDAGANTLTGSAEYDTRDAQAHRSAQFRVGWMFWLAALFLSAVALWAYSRVGGQRRDGAPVSAVTRAEIAPAPAPSPASVVASAGRAVPPSSSLEPAATPVSPPRKVARKPPSPPAPSSTPPWVESR